MSRIGSWLRGSAKVTANGSTRPLTAADESKDLDEAMLAATMIMNDDVDGADIKLKEGNSSFHQLGRGVTLFMRALLGFEQEIMKEASDQLIAAEGSAWADMKRAQKESNGFHSNIYPPGSEFALCHAEAQLMNAVVAVLNESLTESIKGFYKLRKAYITLDGIMAIEEQYVKQKQHLNGNSQASLASESRTNHMPGGFEDDLADEKYRLSTTSSIQEADKATDLVVQAKSSGGESDDDSDLDFVDADEAHSGIQTPSNYLGHVNNKVAVKDQLRSLGISEDNMSNGSDVEASISILPKTPARHSIIDRGLDSEVFANPIDIFVHSGSNLCYGLLLLIISMVPPVFNKLLYVIGFKGDRERGITMLWQSTKFANINGAVAGLVLLSYYNGMLGLCDIVSDSDAYPADLTGYPKMRCQALLAEMRARYPDSRLFRLEEARMHSGDRQLRAAIETLNRSNDSKLKQISALNTFETCLNLMYLHDYALCAATFEACMKLNSWSHALYTFNMGACHVDLYRDLKSSNPAAAMEHKAKAKEYFRRAPTLVGRKKFMAKQMPLDLYVARKVEKWEQRAREWEVDMVDAIGVSPIEEMIYLWNGGKRMDVAELERSLASLEWSRMTSHQARHESNLDEIAIRALLKATTLRNLKRFGEARSILTTEILNHNRNEFKGHLRDDWSCPAAHYEMAVLAWLEKDVDGADVKAKIAECDDWLQKAARWEGYVLDTRIGVKITTGVDTVKRYRKRPEAQAW